MLASSPVSAAETPTSTVPPTVKGLSLVSLFNDFASEMVYPLLPAFVTGTLGGGAVILGLLSLTSVPGSTCVSLRIPV